MFRIEYHGTADFFLHTHTGSYERAIYAEENHNPSTRGFTVSINDDIHVWTNDDDKIDFKTQVGISIMYATNAVPLIVAFWFLSQVFSNVSRGYIFTEKNALYLLYYGLLQFFASLIVPFIKLFICYLVNLVSDSRLSISTGHTIVNTLIPSIAFIVAAYIIHYGIHLQDEVDHTL